MENNQTDYTGKDLTLGLNNNQSATVLVPDSIISSVTSGSKYEVNVFENLDKIQVTKLLLGYKPKTHPIDIAKCLRTIFGHWNTNPEHWEQLARKYTLKSIKSVVWEIIKQGRRDGITLKTPGKLFTYLLISFHAPRRHPKRKTYRNNIKRNKYGIYERVTSKINEEGNDVT